MAILKKLNFGDGAHNIAKTVVTAKSGGVMSVAAPSGVTNGDDENADYQYELDVNVDGQTLVKSTTTGDNPVTQLAVGTVPASQVSVAAGGHTAETEDGKTFVGDDVEEVLLELNTKIENVEGAAKSYSIVDETSTAQDLPTNVLKRYRLQETVGSTDTLVGQPIDILKDNSLLAAKLSTVDATWNGSAIVDGTGNEALVLVYKDANGTAQVIAIDVSAFLKEAEFGDGLQVTNGVVSAKLGNGIEFGSEASGNKSLNVKIDSTSESFLTVGAGGVKLDGVQDAIDDAIEALDVTDTAVAGQYVSKVDEADGVVSVTRANVSEAVLNNYAKGSDATAVAATDTVNQAISKLENQVDAAKAAHSVVDHANGNNHVTVSASQPDATTGAITYTVSETNIADADDLSDEITRAQNAETAIDTAVGLTKAANAETRTFTPTTNYGTGATTVMGNMQALDAQVKSNADAIAALQTQVGAIEYDIVGTTLMFYGIPRHTTQQGS